tara:strand:+ start:136 stop:534 length:399 start_codon:yes stop_codon:yes gene_type:complete
MEISIIGTSQITDFVINKIINHSEKIRVYSEERDYNFENKNKSKKNLEIILMKNIEDKIQEIAKSSEIIFLLNQSDSFNLFCYEKILADEENKKIIVLINDTEIYSIFKNKSIPVITPTEINEQDFSYLVKG